MFRWVPLFLLVQMQVVVPVSARHERFRVAFASHSNKKHQNHLDHRSRRVAKNPEHPMHSTERLEELGRKRNYGTEYTQEKRRRQGDDLQHRDAKGRAWTFGKVPRW